MKKLFLIMSVGVLVTFTASCAKKCNCTRYEDGKKIAVMASNETKYFDKSICADFSETSHQGYSWVVDGKEVTVEIKCK